MKLKSNQLAHIDHNFYHLTAAQAKALSIEGRLPRPGRAIKADPAKLAAFTLGKITGDPVRFQPFENQSRREGWIQATSLSFFNGAPTKAGFVWAVQLS